MIFWIAKTAKAGGFIEGRDDNNPITKEDLARLRKALSVEALARFPERGIAHRQMRWI